MADCSEEFPYTDTLYSELFDDKAEFVFAILSGVITLVIVGIFIEELRFLKKNYHFKKNRKNVKILLSLYPALALFCLLGLLVPRTTMLTELLSITFISTATLYYVRMILTYFGGDTGILEEYKGEVLPFQNPPCCCCCFCLKSVKFSRKNLKIVKILTGQMFIVQPLIIFIATILWTDNNFDLGEAANFSKASIYIQITKSLSTVFAMWGLSILHNGTKSKLRDHYVRPKFASLQFVIVLTTVQQFVLLILAQRDVISCSGTRGPVVRAYRFHYFLLIVEALLLSLLARYGYRRDDQPYKTDVPSNEIKMENSVTSNNQEGT